MKKITLSVLALVIFYLSAIAAQVSESQMRLVVANFWNTYRPAGVKPVEPSQLRRMEYATLPHLGVFATGDDVGFVIVAADDRVRPVLAYSFETPFPEELHSSLSYWLGGYESQIAEAALDDNLPADSRWQRALTATPPVEPLTLVNVPRLMTTFWDQSDPYNRDCPYDESYHARTVVGCVATAMAQIMRYWRHPSCGIGQHSYQYGNYGTLSADFANTTYIWNYMPDRLDMTSAQRELDAVAKLSHHCGVSVNMMYGPSATGGSAAYSNDVINALTTYFRYQEGMNHQYRYRYSDSLWCAKIDEEMNAGRPIYYSGRDSTSGHAFVLDGADTQGRYHFNWGWGGYGDAFYAINDLAPRVGGAGGNATYTFNLNQAAIFGIQPIPQHLDTVDLYDTVCSSSMYYTFYEYNMPPTDGEWLLTHLDTVYRVHVAVAPRRFIHYDPNGADDVTHTSSYCYVTGPVLTEAIFQRPGYTFAGWCLDPYGNGPLYQPGDTLKIHSTVIAYAIWQRNAGIQQDGEPQVAIHPNPATDFVEIIVDGGHCNSVSIVDAMGRTLMMQQCDGSPTVEISLRDFPQGVYLMMVATDNGTCKQRIIKY